MTAYWPLGIAMADEIPGYAPGYARHVHLRHRCHK